MKKTETDSRSEALIAYKQYWSSYLEGDLEAFSSTLDDGFEMIGTSESEVCHSKTDGIEFYKAQMHEVIGKVEMRNRRIDSVWLDPLVLINETCNIYVKTDEVWNFYSKLRLSTLLKETGEGWKVVQQHGSLPDMRVGDGETMGIEKISKENLELRDAIKRRTTELEQKNRELEIEAALERVRSQSMAMNDSSELSAVVFLMFTELVKLDAKLDRCIILIVDPQTLGIRWYLTGKEGLLSNNGFLIPNNDFPSHKAYLEGWRTKQKKWQFLLAGEEKKQWDAYGFSETELAQLPEFIKADMAAVEAIHLSISSDEFGCLIASSLSPLSDAHAGIVERFTVVFNQTYTRFLDLQKAEAQAREAQIEAALEKVRSRSLAMHSSNELNEVVTVLFEKLKDLSIPVSAVGISINIAGSKDLDNYTCGQVESGIAINNYRLPYFDHKIANDFFKAREKQLEFFVGNYSKQEKDSFYEYVIEHTELKNELTEKIKQFIFQSPSYSISVVTTKHTMITLNDFEGGSLSDIEIEILKRFSKVFEQAYIRFLDLQKAEAQAREAQIEAALERVRSRTMAMHNSQEVGESVAILFEELVGLGVLGEDERCGIGIMLPEEKMEAWTAAKTNDGKSVLTIGHLDMCSHSLLKSAYQGWIEKKDFQQYTLQGEDLISYSNAIKSQPNYKIKLGNFLDAPRIIHSDFYFKEGCLYVFSKRDLSAESINVYHRFAAVFGQTYRRYQDLQKAEAQAREAQIEAALERVRAQTMAMHSSDDVGKCVVKMFSELTALGVDEGTRFGIGILNHDNENNQLWTARKTGDEVNLHIGNIDMASHPLLKSARKAWKAQVPFHKYILEGADLLNYYQMLNNAPDYKIQIPIEKLPKKEIQHCFIFEHGFFYAFSPIEFQSELIHITKRFSALFEQTYRRYLDLVRAEAQAREAQIEAALERIRSRTMAMQHSNELTDVAGLLFNQVSALGIKTWTTGFNVWSEDNNSYVDYLSLNGEIYGPNTVHTEKAEALMDLSNARKSGVEFDILYVEGEKIKQLYLAISGIDEKEYDLMVKDGLLPSQQYEHFVFGAKVSVMFITYEPVPEAHDIFKRLGKVFEQTYTRFLDLQKAEAQAREAQIQLSLERIRAKAMAMQHSDELSDFLTVLFEQFTLLDLKPVFCHLSLLDLENNRMTYRMTGSKGARLFSSGQIDLDISSVWYDKIQELKAGRPREVDVMYFPNEIIPEISSHVKEMLGNPPENELPQLEDFPDGQYVVEGYCKYGYLGYSASRPPSEEEKEITKRISNEFGNVYQRFIDLQKAETQALETTKRASVDRVRAEIASMRTTSDLERIQPLIWNELKILNVPFIRCGVFIMDEVKREVKAFLSTPDGASIAAFHLPYQATKQTWQIVSHWQQKQPYKDHMDEAAFAEFTRNLVEQGAMASTEKYVTENRPTDLYLHFLPFLQGMLYVGNDAPLKDEELQLVQNLADAFSTAYARYEDFNKLELAKSEVESAMSELKATQAQLIQQEKLASLGQLTAGIAHEIKNPLNFVNNFSEVSLELVGEIKEERTKNQESRDETLVDEILDDIQSNLEKIHEHGSRANGIVTSMLQHSRGGSGKKEPNDLNAIVKEYVNLSYHGMRAGKNPIDVEIVLDLDSGLGKVSLIKEDFTRLVINLCNNAFDAMRMKTLQGIETLGGLDGYHPKLTVRTKSESDHMLISVEDNGPGIPEEIKDKILQPFFTTKKGTEGTGLGLSITHDIVKAHGGELRIDGKIGEGATFVISLPKNDAL